MERELTVEVEGLSEPRVVRCVGEQHESVYVIVRRALIAADIDHHEGAELVEQDEIVIPADLLLRDLTSPRVKARLTCVVVLFEGQHARHLFPARATWGDVHRWACNRFDVAKDACPNLELREGSAQGSALNEKLPIGRSKACIEVWLVKPGPEPYGGTTH